MKENDEKAIISLEANESTELSEKDLDQVVGGKAWLASNFRLNIDGLE